MTNNEFAERVRAVLAPGQYVDAHFAIAAIERYKERSAMLERIAGRFGCDIVNDAEPAATALIAERDRLAGFRDAVTDMVWAGGDKSEAALKQITDCFDALRDVSSEDANLQLRLCATLGIEPGSNTRQRIVDAVKALRAAPVPAEDVAALQRELQAVRELCDARLKANGRLEDEVGAYRQALRFALGDG